MSKKQYIKLIEQRNCPDGCKIFMEKRKGVYGNFYFCHRCKNSISEDHKGEIAEPCGKCEYCGGLLFWRLTKDGARFKACWSQHLHRSGI